MLFLTLSAFAAEVSLGLAAPYGIQPGLHLGARFDLNERFVLLPRVVAYTRPGNHRSLLTEVGVGLRGPGEGRYNSTVSLGLGYLVSAQAVTESIDLGTGESTPTRELRHFALPSVRYEVARQGADVDLFAGASVGRAMSVSEVPSAFFMVDVGVRFGGAR
jgi:hypothetical protein